MINPFILSGGSGTRLWPLSRRAYPKQFLKLVGEKSLLQQSFQRLDALETSKNSSGLPEKTGRSLFGTPGILCNHEHRFLVAEQLQEIGVQKSSIILEPVGRNTAAAALVAALVAQKEDEAALVLLMPSDHVMHDTEGFQRTISKGVDAANSGRIVTFGVRPDAPESGYGYIETAKSRDAVLDVVRFIEKPSTQKAQTYLDANSASDESGNLFFWNAGIFLYSAQTMIAAFETHAPKILEHCVAALQKAESDLDFLRLDEASYRQCEDISLDYAIMEKISSIQCVPLETPWSDLGAWPALWDIKEKDAQGNVCEGDVVLQDSHNSYAHSEEGTCLALIGVEDMVVVATKDAVLVTPKSRAQDVKAIVDTLKEKKRAEHIYHCRVYRPWGWYEGLDKGERFQVKCLSVNPGAQLSLQSHHHRAEHWVVVSGTAEITLDDETFLLTENESTYIPIGARHRLGNPGKLPALLIEIQSGPYLGEDDIIRYKDDFNRTKEKTG